MENELGQELAAVVDGNNASENWIESTAVATAEAHLRNIGRANRASNKNDQKVDCWRCAGGRNIERERAKGHKRSANGARGSSNAEA